MDVVTYSLRDDAQTSDQYYRDVAGFTDEVLAKAKDMASIVASYRAWLKETGRESVRSEDEYAFELLMLGTLWRNYADDARDVPGSMAGLMAVLSRLRQQGGAVKWAADGLRGILATVFLSPAGKDWHPRATPEYFDRLLRWMDATGDYVQEVKRLRGWRDYLAGRPAKAVTADIDVAIGFAAWFEGRSLRELGRYTPNVEQFLSEKQPGHRWKEDVVFAARPRVEYHLNMVGAEIMNRAFQADFINTKRKVVILPACMRYYPKPKCKAWSNGLSCKCAECTPRCRVNQLTKTGRKFGFDVFLVPHESSVFSGDAGRALIGEGAGIVGIACVPNLVSGGWKARGLGLPPQCVLLDHCGCRKHWHEQGIATDINMSRLMQIMGLKEPKAQMIPA